jgi:hypothetical protein
VLSQIDAVSNVPFAGFQSGFAFGLDFSGEKSRPESAPVYNGQY